MCDITVTFNLDSGAQANVLPVSTYRRIKPMQQLEPTKTVLTAFGNVRIKPVGVIKLQVTCPDTKRNQVMEFFVTDTDDIPILGKDACESMNLLRRVHVDGVTSHSKGMTKEDLLTEYSDVFSGVGMFEKEYDIEVDPSVRPVIQAPRKLPYAKYDQLKETIARLEEEEIIASVDKPTDWVHNLVITEKRNGSLRICLDPRPLNKAIKRERYQIPTPSDVQSQLHGKKIFTVIDMKDGFWHVRLSEKSSYLCTFHTPWGQKRFMRMPFGISSASEVMQKRNEQTFSDIVGVHIIADDMTIAASDEIEHDEIVRKVMQRARDKNIRFNRGKVQYKVSSVTYMGHIAGADGLSVDPAKVEAIVGMPKPACKADLQRLLGMVRYLAVYIPNESAITAPLRMLLRQDVEWDWNHEHDDAVSQIRRALIQAPTLEYYNVHKPATIQCDASQRGLGACLMQDGRPVAYASRALTSAEENYSQIEKEMLAICFSCMKFHQYVYGKSTIVHTDHRPLESILKKPIAKASPRLQRMILQLQRYDLDVKYVPGKYLYVADTLSRAYIQGDPTCGAPEDIEVMVHTLIGNLPVSIEKMDAFRESTANDETMQQLRLTIRRGWPKKMSSLPRELQEYWNVRDELHEADGLVLRGDRLVVPSDLRQDMLKLIHESHQGMDKCKARARTVLYWPGMASDIETITGQCHVCLRFRANNQKEPLIQRDVPELPWQRAAVDIMTFKGNDYLVVVDCYSKYPEIALLESKTAACVINHLKSMFARHGIAEELLSDNMPFASKEFVDFAREWKIGLTTSSPNFPQSNGQAERVVQNLKNILKKCDYEGRDPYLALLEYRNTPITGIDYSPAQMSMSRMLRSKLPARSSLLAPQTVDGRRQLQQRQLTHKHYYDVGSKQLSELQPGSVVRVRQHDVWEPAVVVRKDGHPRSYIISRDGREYRRNRRHLLETPRNDPT